MKWVKLDIEFPKGDFVETIKVDGRKLCLVRHQNKMHVLQNSCPHAGGILSGGWCKNGHIVCPIHRYEYNLETGRGAAGQGDYINIYPLEKRDDGFYVGLKESFWKRFFS
jgi:3-phenylpropionate/trans-cinnamate dioxygenase ferredoxin subunit